MDDATQDTYTPEERETLEAGLRILARMIVREHLRRAKEATGDDGSQPEAPTDKDHSG